MQVNCQTDPRLCGLTQGLGDRGSTSETLKPYESDLKSTLQKIPKPSIHPALQEKGIQEKGIKKGGFKKRGLRCPYNSKLALFEPLIWDGINPSLTCICNEA